MKKKVLTLAVAASFLLPFSSFARDHRQHHRAQSCNAPAACAPDSCTQCTSDCLMLFEGLTLTDAQKQQLRTLNDNQRKARRQDKQARREQRRCADSVARCSRAAEKRSYLDQVKSIVGPEQYVLFLENYYINTPGRDKGPRPQAPARNNRNDCRPAQNCR